jgi:hypothetical protein
LLEGLAVHPKLFCIPLVDRDRRLAQGCSSHFLHLLEPVLFYAALVSTSFGLLYFLSKKDPVKHTFLSV